MVTWQRLATVVGAAATTLVLTGCNDDDDVATDDGRDAHLARGEALYDAHCVACHGGATGGHIADIPPRHNAEGHTWHHPDCLLVDIILEGMPPRGGQVMPAFGDELDESDAVAILDHIKTWWEPDQREFQAEITDEVC